MLRITVQSDSSGMVFRLEGKLSDAWVAELGKAWRLNRVFPDRSAVRVDLTEVSFVDEEGKSLLTGFARQGAELVARGPMMRDLVRKIEAHAQAARLAPEGVQQFSLKRRLSQCG
ncbi:MAG TPA: hypothetical protein VN622_09590 [Clostridia bacterium]|nr:hypothetical protein [Clostridia bacterium]